VNPDELLPYLPDDSVGTCACGRRAVKTDSYGRGVCAKCASYLGPPVVAVRVAGRNDPCPCRSGKKYKKCCGRPPEQAARETGAAVRGAKPCK